MKRKRMTTSILAILLCLSLSCQALAASIPRAGTPNYKVAFYAFDCYHIQDEDGKRSGYGYEMMEGLSRYLQCTFSYVGYDKSASECVEMLRNGELDLYTAAKLTPEREAEFAISTHPAITATTSMNVKVDNTAVKAGDYETYNGLRIGLLRRHTYNDKFLAFIEEKGLDCPITYYETPTELHNALVDGQVDAVADSYIRTPEDERVLEDFGQTPYYIMARKEDQALIDQLDAAIDCMNVETPNWRVELYNKYYGSQELNTELTAGEKAMLERLKADGAVIRAVMDPDGAPYSWYEDGEARGIAADLFRATAEELGLSYEIVPVADRAEYEAALASGDIDVWMDLDGWYSGEDAQVKYRTTDPYLTTTVSVLRSRGASGKIQRLAVIDDGVAAREILSANWPDAELIHVEDTAEAVRRIVSEDVDGALLMTYTAQRLAREDLQNRLRVDIVPGASLDLRMGVDAEDERDFYGLWEKTLTNVSGQVRAEVIQSYVEETATPTVMEYLFDHPAMLILLVTAVLLCGFLLLLYLQSVRSKKRQVAVSDELAKALEEAREANAAKQDFFSKMSHDIRTPLNVVLGMTQIAQKYKYDTPRLENALDSIASEGNYLLVLIESILDVNQLEHGRVELSKKPFCPAVSAKDAVGILHPLAEEKEQELTLSCTGEDRVVVGDANRFGQIMINIISNAVKYTENGGHIRVELDCRADGLCCFVCADDGIGMTEEFIQHITEDYVRAEDSRVSKIHGTGLGMSVVKGFTDLMGGTLSIESGGLGKGSTFRVEIPFAPATEEQRRAVLVPAEEAPGPRFTGKRVLLVEDNALNAEIATELLQSIGLTVDWAENGLDGVKCFEASAPGAYFAVFMDMQMPVMDGVEATRAIRAGGRADSDIPIFAMTANTFAADRKKCRDAGMNGYIPKPIDIQTIETTLEEGTRPKGQTDQD